MTIQETGETLILWINSCETQEQLDLIENDLVHKYIIDRFSETTEILHMELILHGINEALHLQNKKITTNEPSVTNSVRNEQGEKRTDIVQNY